MHMEFRKDYSLLNLYFHFVQAKLFLRKTDTTISFTLNKFHLAIQTVGYL